VQHISELDGLKISRVWTSAEYEIRHCIAQLPVFEAAVFDAAADDS
jgi:hypothetical protein